MRGREWGYASNDVGRSVGRVGLCSLLVDRTKSQYIRVQDVQRSEEKHIANNPDKQAEDPKPFYSFVLRYREVSDINSKCWKR